MQRRTSESVKRWSFSQKKKVKRSSQRQQMKKKMGEPGKTLPSKKRRLEQ